MIQQQFQAGEELISEFIQKVRALPVASMTPEAVLQQVTALQAEVAAHNNPYVSTLLQQSADN